MLARKGNNVFVCFIRPELHRKWIWTKWVFNLRKWLGWIKIHYEINKLSVCFDHLVCCFDSMLFEPNAPRYPYLLKQRPWRKVALLNICFPGAIARFSYTETHSLCMLTTIMWIVEFLYKYSRFLADKSQWFWSSSDFSSSATSRSEF